MRSTCRLSVFRGPLLDDSALTALLEIDPALGPRVLDSLQMSPPLASKPMAI